MLELSGTPVVQRYHPRVEAEFMVKLRVNGRNLVAKAKDLSMAGLSLLGVPAITDQLTVTLPLPGDREITTRATVKRRSTGMIGLEFDQLDWDDMFALARYLNPRLK
ncbi:MAG: PilZ domain-containing protein [Myxococcaceae bacterium]|nr:PilZ domain-containing protein [Myxococcaceae bacterium]